MLLCPLGLRKRKGLPVKPLIFRTRILIFSCATSPDAIKRREIEASFLSFKGEKGSWSKSVEVLGRIKRTDTGTHTKEGAIANYSNTGMIVSYNPDQYCTDLYAVYENCQGNTCQYQFEDRGGLCE